MKRFAFALLCLLSWASITMAVAINELRIDQVGNDDDEYFELAGSPGESLEDLTYLVIGDGSPALGSGVIEAVVSLSAMTIPDSGYFLAAESTFGAPGTVFHGIVPDLTISLNFENNDNVTHVLVNGFFGALNDDLDLDDDGTLDVMPWASLVDAIGLIDDVNTSQAGIEHFYGQALGFTDIGPDGSFVPGHVYRIPDQTGGFVIGRFGLDPTQGMVDDTPGASNEPDVNPQFNCEWVDRLIAAIVGGMHLMEFDLNGDGLVNRADLLEWRIQAGAALNASGNPILEGDANLDGFVDGQDFITWNLNKFTVRPAWCAGDFNADGVIDGQDFILWNNNKFQMADGGVVPEPISSSSLFAILGMAVPRLRHRVRSTI